MYFLSAGVHFEPSPVQNWQSLFSSQEMNCSPEQSLDCFLNPTWDKSTDQYANFESALSSKVSSPAASNSAVSNDSFEIPELIGKLATICNSGEISPQSPQSPPSIVVNLNYHRPFFIPQTRLSYSSPAMEKKMENRETNTISEEEPTTAHAIANSSPARSPSPSPSPPRDPTPSLPSARSRAESSVSSDLRHRTSLSHGSSPRENPSENVKPPSPQQVVNRFVRESSVRVKNLGISFLLAFVRSDGLRQE
ncbi:unnamed protein product [Camellia sinensis]